MNKQAMILMDVLTDQIGAEYAVRVANAHARDRRDTLVEGLRLGGTTRAKIAEIKACHAIHSTLRDDAYNTLLAEAEENLRYETRRAKEVLKLSTKAKVRDITDQLEDVEY